MNKTDNHYNLLAFSFSQGFNSPNIPIASFHQGDTELNFIIDTGSDLNLIDADAIKKLEYKMLPDKANLTGIGGTQVVERCEISFSNDTDSFTTEFLISDIKESFKIIKTFHAIQLHGMLGALFLKENNLVLDFKNFAAYTKEE